ncbi:MAG: diguanylate cyclase [Oceanospirillaceae bacterium]|nr:diguanylate cyclase [Oceanospirillaceae bacterium]
MFRETATNAMYQAKRNQHDLYLMCIDLDHSNCITDELGHCAGHSLLRDESSV